MVDVHTKEIRSFNMSRIKSRNTKPEVLIRKFLFSNGFRFRINEKRLPGKPDIVLPKYKTVIFVNGCFWHGHVNCKYFRLPASNTEWWRDKIQRTAANDQINLKALTTAGFRVITVWECQIKDKSVFESLVDDVRN